MKKPPLVSVVIPVFNCEKYLKEAIESVLAQTYKNCEIIIVNDGSTDRTIEILEGYRYYENLRLMHHESHANRGVSISRKLGVTSARGDFISFLDADDFVM